MFVEGALTVMVGAMLSTMNVALAAGATDVFPAASVANPGRQGDSHRPVAARFDSVTVKLVGLFVTTVTVALTLPTRLVTTEAGLKRRNDRVDIRVRHRVADRSGAGEAGRRRADLHQGRGLVHRDDRTRGRVVVCPTWSVPVPASMDNWKVPSPVMLETVTWAVVALFGVRATVPWHSRRGVVR